MVSYTYDDFEKVINPVIHTEITKEHAAALDTTALNKAGVELQETFVRAIYKHAPPAIADFLYLKSHCTPENGYGVDEHIGVTLFSDDFLLKSETGDGGIAGYAVPKYEGKPVTLQMSMGALGEGTESFHSDGSLHEDLKEWIPTRSATAVHETIHLAHSEYFNYEISPEAAGSRKLDQLHTEVIKTIFDDYANQYIDEQIAQSGGGDPVELNNQLFITRLETDDPNQAFPSIGSNQTEHDIFANVYHDMQHIYEGERLAVISDATQAHFGEKEYVSEHLPEKFSDYLQKTFPDLAATYPDTNPVQAYFKDIVALKRESFIKNDKISRERMASGWGIETDPLTEAALTSSIFTDMANTAEVTGSVTLKGGENRYLEYMSLPESDRNFIEMGFKLMDRKIEGLQGKDVMEALQTALAEDNETQNMTHAQVTEKQRMLEYFAEIPTNHNNQLFLSGEGRITQEDKALVLPHGKRFMDSFFADVAQKNVELAQDLGIDPATLRAPQEKISTTQQQAAELVKENLDSLPPTIAPLAGKEIKLAPTAANINFATPSHTQTL